MPKISALVHTYNSDRYLSECLASLKWVDEINVMDMGSTDRTLQIASDAGAIIYKIEFKGLADPARQFGLSKATHDWVLTVDSDEIIPNALQARLKEAAANDEADVFYLSFRNFFFGRELKGTGWSYKDIKVPRFFKKGFMTYGELVHEFSTIRSGARIKYLCEKDLAVIHFNYDSISHFIQKLDRYTNFEADKLTGAGFLKNSIFYQGTREFDGRFWLKRGFLDGWVGFYLAFAMAFYRFTAIMKHRLPKESEVISKYKQLAQKVLSGEKL